VIRILRLRGFALLALVLSVTFTGLPAQGANKGVTQSIQFGTPVQGDLNSNKISAGMKRIVADYESAVQEGSMSQSMQALYSPSRYFRLTSSFTQGAPQTDALISVTDPGVISQLQQLGVSVDATAGDVLICKVPVQAVGSIAALEGVNKIDVSGWSYPLLNQSRVETRVDQVHSGAAGQPFKGSGVLVGVLDSGIDFAHPDFNVATNNTRIRALLDFGNAGQSGNPTEFSKAQIDAGQCTEVDGTGAHGHGTHVTGIAAGGGRRNASYIGMAPESEILFVKGIRDPQSNGGFSNNDVIYGVEWIFGKADALNKPCVINLSLGGHYGPHDGSSLYEQALSSMVKPGRIIVAAAGNEGFDYIHTSFTAEGSNYDTAPEVLWTIPQGSTQSYVDLWYPQANSMSVGIGVYTVNSGQLVALAHSAAVAPGSQIQNVVLQDQGGTTLGTVSVDATTTQDPNNGDREVLFSVSGANVSNYIWTVYALGNGALDAWVISSGQFYPPVTGLNPLYKFGDNNKCVGSPGTAKKIVCVGAYVTKNQWVDVNGNTQLELNPGDPNPVVPAIGQLAYFSSHGPSRDGRTKPDFVAPGEVIVSALSTGFTTVPSEYVLQGGGLQKQQGTSQASPHITGIVALMLQKNRYLTYENVVTVLKNTAALPSNPPANSQNLWGSGKVNALAAMNAIPAGMDCAALARYTGFDCEGNRLLHYELFASYPNPFNPSTTIAFQLKKGGKIDLAIFDVLGRRIRTIASDELPEGYHSMIWDGLDDHGRQASSGVYYARLAASGFSAANKLLMLK
jgi:minor extracellular serine protease Vpr